MIAIVDYGVGNLFSLKCSFASIGAEAVVTGDADVIHNADRIILPGVGAFGDAAAKLRATGLDVVLKEEAAKGKPLMGICLGMQLLFEKGYEYGEHEGLGLIKGEIRPIADYISADKELKIPHIGWNQLHITDRDGADAGQGSPLFKYIRNNDCVYFVHSYCGVKCDDSLIATTEYDAELTAAVADGNVYGCQFHPEKSGAVGINILKAFTEI